MAIDRYQIAADALTLALSCLDNSDCTYMSFVSVGDPPQDCSFISASPEGVVSIDYDMDRCILTDEESFSITINRCCMTNSSGLEFDAVKEDADARCFWQDFDTVYNCLRCDLASIMPSGLNCDTPVVKRGRPDARENGGCFSATIEFSFQTTVCCE